MKKATIREEQKPIRTYIWDKPSRYPILFGGGYRFVYPYTMEDRLLHKAKDKAYTQVVLENEYIKLIVLPDLGGHLWSAYDKVSGKEVFYNNQAVKPGLIGLRGAWCATGVEWNFPVGHSVSTVSQVDHTCMENEDGSVTVVVGDLDRTTRMRWTVKITVHPGQLAFQVDTVLSNPTGYPHRYMYWENCAVHATEGFQFISPAKVAWTWGGKSQFPVVDGVDKSWYIAHPRAIDYFMLGLGQDYFGYYDHKRRFGAVHVADYHLMPGKKFFTWGMAEHAVSWQKNLTDDDGPYIELQCGLTPTQASFEFFPPQSARRWDEMWYSIGDLGTFAQANRNAALHIGHAFDKAPYPAETEVAVVTNRVFDGAEVVISAGGKRIISEKGVNLKAGKPARWKVNVPKGAKELTTKVTCGSETVIEYSTREAKNVRELPYDNDGSLWRMEKGSPAKLVAAGISWLKWFEYEKALRLIDKALKARPGFVEAHYWKGNIFFDLCKYDAARRELVKVTKANENHATARFMLGQAERYAGRLDAAMEYAAGLMADKKASRMGAQLAGEVAMARGDYPSAAKYFGQATKGSGTSGHTMALLAAALRRAGKVEKAREAAEAALAIDPLEFMALNEGQLAGCSAERDKLMRGEVESYIELASYYEDAGLFDDAAAVLEHYRTKINKGECNAMVGYHLGWVNGKLGRRSESQAFFDKASACGRDRVFPFRREDMLALEAAIAYKGGDALAHYLLGCFLAWRQQEDKVFVHWTKALRGMGDYPVLLRNVALYHKQRKEHAKALTFYKRAIKAAPTDEELYVEADDTAAKVGNMKGRIALLESGLAEMKHSQKIRQLLAQSYYYAGRYEKALDVLMSEEYDHWEGDRRAHETYTLSHMALGKNLLKKKKYTEALESFQKAMEYPANLKIGKPAFPRHAPQLYFSAVAYEALGEEEKAREALEQGGTEIHQSWEGATTEEGYYKGLCLAQLGRVREARTIWRRLTKGTEHWAFSAWHNEFIKGLGYQGLEDWKKAVSQFEKALESDKTNSKVKYHLSQAKKGRQAGL